MSKPEDNCREHFDIALSKRALAVAAGAVEIAQRDLGEKIRQCRPASLPPAQLKEACDGRQ